MFSLFKTLVITLASILLIFADAKPQIIIVLAKPPLNQLKSEHLWKLQLNNPTPNTYKVFLTGSVTERTEGTIFEARSSVFELPPGIKNIAMKDLGSISILSSRKDYEEMLIRTGTVKEGDYEICVTATNAEDKIDLGKGCINQSIVHPNPPILLYPCNGCEIETEVVEFSWTPITPPMPGVTYGLKIVEILSNQTPEAAIQNNLAWFEKRDIPTTTLTYPTAARKLEPGKKYAWSVEAIGVRSEISSFNIGKEVIHEEKASIRLISPTEERPAQNNIPTFEWKIEPALEGVTYSITVRELEEGADIESGKMVFERSGIRETIFRYPAEIAPLDTAKVYVWKVTGIKDGKVIAVSRLVPIPWTWCICWLILQQPTQKICLGSTPPLCVWAIMFGGTCTGPWSWTLTNPNNSTSSGTSTTFNFCVPPSSIFVPTTPGVYTYTLTVTRGTCTRTRTFTVYVYPTFTNASISLNPVCSGRDAAVLTLNGINPDNAQVNWHYIDTPGPPFSFTTWGTGISINTNIIEATPCTLPGLQQVIRTYRATVNLSQWNLPPVPPYQCPNFTTVDVIVDCPTQAGQISVTSTSTHTIVNNKICSDKNNDGFPDYDVLLNVSLVGVTVGIPVWTVSVNNGPPTSFAPGIYTITAAGTYAFNVKVQNGVCDPITRSRTITVVDPPPVPTIQVIEIDGVPTNGGCPFEVCPHDDAVLRVTNWTLMPAGTKYKWWYRPNQPTCPTSTPPAAPWIFAGEGYEQNTNEIGPLLGLPWSNVWWIVTAQDQNAICDPVPSSCCEIKVIKPPCAPVISIAGPNPKCPDQSVTLNATIPPCGPIISYQWYWYGMPYGSPIPVGSSPTISVTKPGRYYLVAQGPCEYAKSNTVIVRDHEVKVKIDGICCSIGVPITLTATGTSTCPPGTGTYAWSPPGGILGGIPIGKTYTVNPAVTTTYTVIFTDVCGCKATASFTITVCH